jgi:DtxR family transcriptional regulator, Mn-dependent transcriptional regulator
MRTFCGLTTDGMLEYLAVIYQLADTGDRVTTTAIAERMCVSLPAASSMLKRLEESGFVDRSSADGVTLTEQGKLAALQLLRRHRLLEVFLIQVMGFTWDQVEAEAHRLEHAISSAFEERMDALCGFPSHCPHGDPIPRPDGSISKETLVPVPQLQPGESGMLRRVASRDASVLRYLSQLKLTPGCHVRLVDRAPFNGPITLELHAEHDTEVGFSSSSHTNGRSSHLSLPNADHEHKVYTQILGTELADQLFVVPQAAERVGINNHQEARHNGAD